jgi:hypothetical protein
VNSLGSGQSLPTNTIKLADQLCSLGISSCKSANNVTGWLPDRGAMRFPNVWLSIWMFPSINTKPDHGTLSRWTNVVPWNFNIAKLQPIFGPPFPNSDACTDAPQQRRLLTDEQSHQLERAFYLAKCAGSRVNCALLHVTFVMFFFCREIYNAREEWVLLGLALNWDNVISKSIWCYCTLQLSSLHISSQTVRVCRPAHDIFHTWSLNLPHSYNTCDMLVSPHGMGLHWPRIWWHASTNSRNLLQLVMQLVPAGRGGAGGRGC